MVQESPRQSAPEGAVVSVLVSIGIPRPLLFRPQQTADLGCDRPPDRVRHVLVARGHGRTRPAHDPHHRALRNAKNEQHRRRSVPGIVKPAITYTSRLKERLPSVVIGGRIERAADR